MYDISVIVAVYNCGPYIEDMFDSLLAQHIDPEAIEIILVDDGSTDDGPEICRRLCDAHPGNTVLISKQNGGVSSARNAGLDVAKGRYINFTDADDKLAPNCLPDAVRMLDDHPDVDIAAFPIYYFGGRTDEHNLNWKFGDANRIADLYDEPWIVQMSASSAVFRRDAWGNTRFDEKLKYAEDAKAIQQLLLQNRRIALMSREHAYYYRRREEGEQSAIQSSAYNPDWYIPYMEKFQMYILDLRDDTGQFPEFLKYVLMHDLQYHIKDSLADEVLSADQAQQYGRMVREVLGHIDDDIILAQRRLYYRHKLLVLKLKYDGRYELKERDGKYYAVFGETLYQLNRPNLKGVRVTKDDSKYVITGRLERIFDRSFEINLLNRDNGHIYAHILINKEADLLENTANNIKDSNEAVFEIKGPIEQKRMLGELFQEFYDIRITLPLEGLERDIKLGLQMRHEGITQNVKLFFDDEMLENGIAKGGIKFNKDIVISYEQTILISRGSIKAKLKHLLKK